MMDKASRSSECNRCSYRPQNIGLTDVKTRCHKTFEEYEAISKSMGHNTLKQ